MLPSQDFVGIELCVELLKGILVAENSDSNSNCLVLVKQVRTHRTHSVCCIFCHPAARDSG